MCREVFIVSILPGFPLEPYIPNGWLTAMVLYEPWWSSGNGTHTPCKGTLQQCMVAIIFRN